MNLEQGLIQKVGLSDDLGRLLVTCAYYVLPAVILASIWFPVIAHYFVPKIVITEKMIDIARRVPTDTVLDEINRFFELSSFRDRKKLIASAEMALQEEFSIPGSFSASFGFPFDAKDFDKKLPGWQFYFSTLVIPEILLSAYDATGRDDFLIAAKEIILGFAFYERKAWLPKGPLWNDHVISERISVMAKFWKLYRNHPDYQFEVASDLFQFVGRSAQLLAKPAHFTFSTNHGIMQNLALLQICIAFPTIPNIESYKQIAIERLLDQMKFYVNDEGVVLEHSALYQRVGLKFIDMAFRYLTLLNLPISEDWKRKYQKANDFYAQLQRPDGSLPMFGDTVGGRQSRIKLTMDRNTNGQSESQIDKKKWILAQPHRLYPIAGYTIWWDGLDELPNWKKLNQTVVTWSYFPGHAHKHADEMSVLLWAGGHNWLTNIGYWPYGTKGRSQAVSWAGSNAPHLVNEPTNSKRQSKLLGYSWSDSLVVIDLERDGPDGYVARRQVLHVKPNIWIVIDNTFGNEDQRTTTAWTTSYHVNLSKGEHPDSYILEAEDSSVKLTKFILTSKSAKVSQFKGSVSPFAGWESNRPAPAIVIEQPAKNSWAAAIWLLQELDGESRKFNSPPLMETWKNSANWQIRLPFDSGLMSIWREENRLFFQEDVTGSGTRKKFILSEPPQITDELAEIHRAYRNAAMKYPRKGYYIRRYLKLTWLLFVFFLFLEAVFVIYRKYGWKYYTELRGMGVLGWIAIGILLFGVYL